MNASSAPAAPSPRQHLNLMHLGLQPTVTAFGAKHAVLACTVAVLGVLILSLALNRWSDHLAQETQRWQTQAQALLAQAPEVQARPELAHMHQDISRLRQQVSAQQALIDALQSQTRQQAAVPRYGDQLQALARQAEPHLWLTGVNIAGDTGVLQLQGRMLQAHTLPVYLRKLGTEPLFQGREFVDLKLESGPKSDEAPQPWIEFSLRAVPRTLPSSGGSRP